MSKTKAFDAQIAGIVNKTREDIYGPPAAHFKASAAVKAILREGFTGDPALLHAMEMIADKLVRLRKTPDHFDSWLDIAGYARTGVMVIDAKDEERKAQGNA